MSSTSGDWGDWALKVFLQEHSTFGVSERIVSLRQSMPRDIHHHNNSRRVSPKAWANVPMKGQVRTAAPGLPSPEHCPHPPNGECSCRNTLASENVPAGTLDAFCTRIHLLPQQFFIAIEM